MKIVSIDIETTGLDPHADQILSVAAVVNDPDLSVAECPHRVWYVRRNRIAGSPVALLMNQKEIRICGEIDPTPVGNHDLVDPIRLGPCIREFIRNHFGLVRCTVAGKNAAGFDLPFLANAGVDFPRHRAVLDPGPMWTRPDDRRVPSLEQCVERAGVTLSGETHDALRDARATLACIRVAWERQ